MSDQPARNKSENPVLFKLLSSNAIADVLVLFRRNPGLIDTVEGISRRAGMKVQATSSAVSELEELAILKKKKIGISDVYFLDQEKDEEAKREVGNYISSLQVTKSK